MAYATGPGSVAADGTGRNGVYTKHLIRNMKKPGLKIEDVLKKVRVAVYSETGKQQTPWVLSSMTGDFYINTGGGNVNIVLPSSPEVKLPPSTQGLGDYDAVLKGREQARSKWEDWQDRMDKDYNKAEAYDKADLLTAKEKADLWTKFLSSYGSDNPYGNHRMTPFDKKPCSVRHIGRIEKLHRARNRQDPPRQMDQKTQVINICISVQTQR